MAIVTTIRRSIWAKIYSLKKWRNVIIDIMVILVIPLPIVLLSCSKRGELPDAKANRDCPASALISSNPDDNRRKIVNYPLVDSVRYLNRLGLKNVDAIKDVEEPVVVTATSSNHFSLATRLVETLTSNMTPKLKIIVFDIGMTDDQRKQMCTNGECEVRRFPFDSYPDYLEKLLPACAWKPVIIQIALQEFGFVIWMDSAVYIPDGNLQPGIDIARREGIAAGHKMIANPDINLAYETDTMTFKSLGEEPCAFIQTYRFNAALLFIKRTPFTSKYIMRPWVSCALTKSCIAADYSFNSKCAYANKYGFCHRFDQSVLSIILNRLFHSNTQAIDLKGKVRWTKCYVYDEVVVFNEMVFTKETRDGIDCPDTKAVKTTK